MNLLIATAGIGTIVALLLMVLVLASTVVPLLKSNPPPKQIASPFAPLAEGTGISGWMPPNVVASGFLSPSLGSTVPTVWALTNQGEFWTADLAAPAQKQTSESLNLQGDVTCSSSGRGSLMFGSSSGEIVFAGVNVGRSNENFSGPTSWRQQRHELPADFPSLSSLGLRARNSATEPGKGWSKPTTLTNEPLAAFDFQMAPNPIVIGEESLAKGQGTAIAGSSEEGQLRLLSFEFAIAESTNPARLGQSNSSEFDLLVTQLVEQPIRNRQGNSPSGAGPWLFGLNHRFVAVVWQPGVIDLWAIDGTTIRQVDSLVAAPGNATITTAAKLGSGLGFVCGTSDGKLLSFSVPASEQPRASSEASYATGPGAYANSRLIENHQFEVGTPIRAIATDPTQPFVIFCTGNQWTVLHLPTEQVVANESLEDKAPGTSRVTLALDVRRGLVTVLNPDLEMWSIDDGHAEASWRGLWAPLWYAGEETPVHDWHAPTRTENNQGMRFGLVPVLLGTLKATLCAMLFALPIAFGGAIYSSEFSNATQRSVVQPTIEMMASFPGVVSGFIVAAVVGPIVRVFLIPLCVFCIILPTFYLAIGATWRELTQGRARSWSQEHQLLLLMLLLPIPILLAVILGTFCEQWWFDGSFVIWISARGTDPFGGWMLVGVVVAAVFVLGLGWSKINRLVDRLIPSAIQFTGILRLLTKFTLPLLLVGALGWVLARLVLLAEWDLRTWWITDYETGNALVVGLGIGFGVIPLVYSVALDALRSVPEYLRSAAVACGATQWQTTVRVVLPSAFSGVISAAMIGFGRATGETMIVLMVVGNRSLFSWNPLSGMQTLTQTIATELPMSLVGTSHYRVLFLAALILFVTTLAVNLLAEFVRRRLRRAEALE